MQGTINNTIDTNSEYLLRLGDYSYRNPTDCWLSIIEPINGKEKVTIGNHETPKDSDDNYLSEEANTNIT